MSDRYQQLSLFFRSLQGNEGEASGSLGGCLGSSVEFASLAAFSSRVPPPPPPLVGAVFHDVLRWGEKGELEVVVFFF